jgi:photosynthetic reaction center cytochrome c subunit
MHRLLVPISAIGLLLLTACERPPIETTQVGFRGTGMVDVQNPRAPRPELGYPPGQPQIPDVGPKAGEIYQNVQVLGDLSVARFTRLMAAITAWVSPEQGCNYCHYPENLADDGKYTKIVSRRMIQMTHHINDNWASHVGDNGVNCYTCHRGKNVPEYIWFSSGYEAAGMTAYAGNRMGQNRPSPAVAYSTLPSDPFTQFLSSPDGPRARVAHTGPFPPPEGGNTFPHTEAVYALMMNWADGLGVNCTYCHMTSAFHNWQTSTPARITAFHGMNMVRDLNADYLTPLQPVYPDHRLGETGDAPKAFCATCHQGVNKPLGGADAVSDYPSLRPGGPSQSAREQAPAGEEALHTAQTTAEAGAAGG